MRWAWCAAWGVGWGCTWGAYWVLVGPSEGKRPLERPWRTWEDNIKMYLQEANEWKLAHALAPTCCATDHFEDVTFATEKSLWRHQWRSATCKRLNNVWCAYSGGCIVDYINLISVNVRYIPYKYTNTLLGDILFVVVIHEIVGWSFEIMRDRRI